MEIFFITTSIAGFAVIWRNWLEDHQEKKEYIKTKLGSYNKVLLCGSCFTYWIALISLLFTNPLQEMKYLIDSDILFFFASWMSISYISVFLRFLYVLIQETVSEKVHKTHHKH